MLNGIHGHQDIERVVYGRPAGAALRAEAERLKMEITDPMNGDELAATVKRLMATPDDVIAKVKVAIVPK